MAITARGVTSLALSFVLALGTIPAPALAQMTEEAVSTRVESASRHGLAELVENVAQDLPGTTTQDKISALYSRLATVPVITPADDDVHNLDSWAVAALDGSESTSGGVARAFVLVADEIGVNALEVTGADSSAWSMVEVDGLWRHVDAARATGSYDSAWFMLDDAQMASLAPSAAPWKLADGAEAPRAEDVSTSRGSEHIDSEPSAQQGNTEDGSLTGGTTPVASEPSDPANPNEGQANEGGNTAAVKPTETEEHADAMQLDTESGLKDTGMTAPLTNELIGRESPDEHLESPKHETASSPEDNKSPVKPVHSTLMGDVLETVGNPTASDALGLGTLLTTQSVPTFDVTELLEAHGDYFSSAGVWLSPLGESSPLSDGSARTFQVTVPHNSTLRFVVRWNRNFCVHGILSFSVKNNNGETVASSMSQENEGVEVLIADVSAGKAYVDVIYLNSHKGQGAALVNVGYGIISSGGVSMVPTEADGVDWWPVYDPAYYAEQNPDVARWARAASGNIDGAKLLQHFVTSGIKEGRKSRASFDLASYYNANWDLRNTFDNDWSKYYRHYATSGSKEGRVCKGVTSLNGYVQSFMAVEDDIDWGPVYDGAYYAQQNPDVKGWATKRFASGSVLDDRALLRHFKSSGAKEGRRSKAGFDLASYFNANPDLRRAFGTSDWSKYYRHYATSGAKEGRVHTGVGQLRGYVTSRDGVDWSPVYDGSYYASQNSERRRGEVSHAQIQFGVCRGRRGAAVPFRQQRCQGGSSQQGWLRSRELLQREPRPQAGVRDV